MSEYTAEDFKNARFAAGPDALRHNAIWDDAGKTWRLGSGAEIDVRRLARGGWRPLHESIGAQTQNLREDADALRREIEDLRDHIAVLTQQLSAQEGTIAALRDFPLTLDTLREAWENAEVPTADSPIRVGDECIMPMDDLWMVGLEGDDWVPSNDGETRVLRRAPQPEQWQALADVLSAAHSGGWFEKPLEFDKAAHHLHNSGVRLVGGDET